MSPDLRFVAYHDPGDKARRIRSRRACSDCRQKKRRCHHQPRGGRTFNPPNITWAEARTIPQQKTTANAGPDAQQGRGASQGPSESPGYQSIQSEENQDQRASKRQKTNQPPQPELEEEPVQHASTFESLAAPPTPRFVGDLNPEARLLDKTTTTEEAQEMAPGEVGVWLQPRPCSNCGSSGNHCSPLGPYHAAARAPVHSFAPVSDLVSEKTIKALSDIYFENVQPIIPLLNEEEYWQSLSRRTIPPALVHVVCLLAAKDSAAGQHLRLLQSGDALVQVREFCSQLYASLSTVLSRRTTMKADTTMRILGLLSLHQEGSEGMKEASSCIAQAMHSAQSMALHLPRPTAPGESDLKRVFWCLWTLDRLNSATNSRPCIIADIDIGVPELAPGESGSVAFDVCFRVAKMLNKVIGLYRPRSDNQLSELDMEFPGFDQIIDEMHAWNLSTSTIATLHIFYLATAILAHRLKTIITLPSPTPARLRQQLSAIQVIRYTEKPERLNALHPFPIIVYAVSLALSVSYQQLRYSRLPSDQEDARRDFIAGCEVLQELRRKWGAADAMGSLARRISNALNELPKLDLLQVNRSNQNGTDHTVAARPTTDNRADDVNGQQPETAPLVPNDATSVEGLQTYLDTMDLFSGMDDVSWMYLDAENPITLDSFPLMDFNGSFGAWQGVG